MVEKHVRADFDKDRWGFTTDGGDVHAYTDTSGPYEYLLGALSGCLFSTFDGLAAQHQVTYGQVTFQVRGVKRDEDPAWLQSCHIQVTVTGAGDQEAFRYWFGQATRHCSIYQTLAHVAKMSWDIGFDA